MQQLGMMPTEALLVKCKASLPREALSMLGNVSIPFLVLCTRVVAVLDVCYSTYPLTLGSTGGDH